MDLTIANNMSLQLSQIGNIDRSTNESLFLTPLLMQACGTNVLALQDEHYLVSTPYKAKGHIFDRCLPLHMRLATKKIHQIRC